MVRQEEPSTNQNCMRRQSGSYSSGWLIVDMGNNLFFSIEVTPDILVGKENEGSLLISSDSS
jgi:hypothetical protein